MKSTKIVLFVCLIGMLICHITNNISGIIGNGFLAVILLLSEIWINQLSMMEDDEEEEGK